VWAQGADKAYDLYMGKANVPMSAAAQEEYPRRVVEIGRDDNCAGMILQKDQSEFFPKDHPPAPGAFQGAYFVHFMRSDFHGEGIQERIYLNVHPDHALD